MANLEFEPDSLVKDGYSAKFEWESRLDVEKYAFENTSIEQIVLLGQLPDHMQPLVYRFPNPGLEKVFEIFNVGYRIGSNDPEISQLLDQLALISQHSTLIPYLASNAAIKLRIKLPLGLETAELIDRTITHFAAEPMIDEDGTISDTISVSGRMHFWWD